MIAAPIYEHKYYCINDYIRNLKELSYPNKDILLVDNSKNPGAHKLVKEFNDGVTVEYIGFYETTRASQCEAYNRIRDVFLAGDYEYLVTIESDLFPPEDIIEQLIANDKDICGCPYQIFGQNAKNAGILCVTTGKITYKDGVFQESFMCFEELDGELKQVQGGIGLGCVVIKRKVLEEIKFRWNDCHADTYFHRDAHRRGFETWLDTRFIIPHYPSEYPEYF